MKRIFVDKNVRRYITYTLVIAQIVVLIMLYQAYRVPVSVEREIVHVQYTQTGNFEYIINLNPNKLYETSSISGMSYPNRTYFTKITRDIDTIFRYKFVTTNGSNAQISGNYDLVAVLSTDTWEKRFILIPKKEFSGINRIDFTEYVTIDINYYGNLLANITKETDVQPKIDSLKLIYNINSIITKDGEQKREVFTPTVIFTSVKGGFNIQGDINKKSDNSIKTIVKDVRLDILTSRIRYYIIFVAIFIVTAVFWLITKNKTEDKKIDITEIIKKKYGDYIVEANEVILPEGCPVIEVRTIEDLIKVCEEIEEPIIHKFNTYYIYDGSTRYKYSIEDEKL